MNPVKPAVMARADALHFWPEFEKILESETDPRRKAFLEFMKAQSFAAVSEANALPQPGGDVTLDMRGVAALASCLFQHQGIVFEILSGSISEEDWSS